MRLCSLSILAFASIVNSIDQIPAHFPLPPTISSTTLVDALSADPDYTSLLRLLQRARLIPTLNKLNDSTLFAPTNDAIKRRSSADPFWYDALHAEPLNDNIQYKLRQELLYHLLNYSIVNLPTQTETQVHKTLHFPYSPQSEPDKPPPWLPEPGGTLGGEPQRVRVASRDDHAWVGVDAFGKGGAEIVKGQVNVKNGVLLGISDVLTVPPDLATVLGKESSVSYFHNILTPEITKLLKNTTELTIFLPVDAAWEELDSLERLYLESEFATDDLNRILNMHAVIGDTVTWSDSFEPAVNLTTIDGRTLEIVVTPDQTAVSWANLVQPDIYASNGVLHLVSSLLIPDGALLLTPEKYLLALNCTSFVSLLHSVDLTTLINSTDTKYTILAPRDDVLSVFGGDELPEKGSDELKRLLQYHFLPGRWTPKHLKDGMLLETALEEVGLDGGRQVLSVDVDDALKERNIRFGGAGTIGDHIEINNTLIYFVSRPLLPPTDALQTALPKLDLSSFLAAIFSTSLADMLKTTPRTTLLIPHNSAFKRLGLLVSEHLLAASSKSDLESVILHHAIDGVEYAESLLKGTQRTFPTLEGSDIKLERRRNTSSISSGGKSLVVSASGGWVGMKAALYPKDMLTQTGVIHELSDLIIPRSVDLTVGKLVKAASGNMMSSLIVKAGMDWVLNGTAPPEESPRGNLAPSQTGWTLLCPTDDAFKKFNLTDLFNDVNTLRAIVTQHLIPMLPDMPSTADDDGDDDYSIFDALSDDDSDNDATLNNNRPIAFADSTTYQTLRSPSSSYGDIIFRRLEEKNAGGYVVGINGARGTNGKADWARVLAWGRSTTSSGTGGVVQIDRVLVPYYPPWWIEYGGPAIVGVGGLMLICAFFYGVRAIWKIDATEATYEPVGGFGQDDEA